MAEDPPEVKYNVEILVPEKSTPTPKQSVQELKELKIKGKQLARMNKEAVDCPVLEKRVSEVAKRLSVHTGFEGKSPARILLPGSPLAYVAEVSRTKELGASVAEHLYDRFQRRSRSTFGFSLFSPILLRLF